MNSEEIIAFNKNNIRIGVSRQPGEYIYFAIRDLKKDEKIMQCYGKITDRQTSRESMQIGRGYHILPEKWLGKHLNHSCDPNAYVNNIENGFPTLYALRDIKKGEEINYHFAMTEFAWAKHCIENFSACSCGSPACKGRVLSFSQLPLYEQKHLLNNKHCSDYLMPVPLRNGSFKVRLNIIRVPDSGIYIAA